MNKENKKNKIIKNNEDTNIKTNLSLIIEIRFSKFKILLFVWSSKFITMVPGAGLEPARSCLRGILSPLCLPIPPPRL
tara:strand:+ start:946 stop:1179 length:234 start_codon:yes stop_codon:yes gene_type:complete